jgi:hypothetical protein
MQVLKLTFEQWACGYITLKGIHSLSIIFRMFPRKTEKLEIQTSVGHHQKKMFELQKQTGIFQ